MFSYKHGSYLRLLLRQVPAAAYPREHRGGNTSATLRRFNAHGCVVFLLPYCAVSVSALFLSNPTLSQDGHSGGGGFSVHKLLDGAFLHTISNCAGILICWPLPSTDSPARLPTAGLGSIVLIAATALSLYLSNSAMAESWLEFWHIHAARSVPPTCLPSPCTSVPNLSVSRLSARSRPADNPARLLSPFHRVLLR